MKALLFKQFRLTAHPATYPFCLFAAMLLIPNYPYTVASFYVTLGLFFTFQNGREQRDGDFSALLPVRKRDTVRSAMLFCVLLEGANLLLSVGFVCLSSRIAPAGGNAAGIDANVALLGFAFLVYAVFHAIFFPAFYRTGYRVGSAFLKASAGVLAVVAADIVLPHIVPWLDGHDPRQWFVLLGGAAVYGAVTALSCRAAEARYERVDL